MKKVGNSFELSATDLVGYLYCHHLTALDRAVAEGALPKPKVWDPLLQILWERGAAHERSYVEYLTKAGLDVVRIDGVEVTGAAVADTLAAMRGGVPIIVQALSVLRSPILVLNRLTRLSFLFRLSPSSAEPCKIFVGTPIQ